VSIKLSSPSFPKPKRLEETSSKIRAQADIAFSNSEYYGLKIGSPMHYYPGRSKAIFKVKCLERGHPMENKMLSFSTPHTQKKETRVICTLVF